MGLRRLGICGLLLRARGFALFTALLEKREIDSESRVLTHSHAICMDLPAMQIHETTHNRQSESAVRSDRCPVRLAKAVKDMRQKLRADSLSSIANHNFNVRVDPSEPDADLTPAGCKLDGVGEQIPDREYQFRYTFHHTLSVITDLLRFINSIFKRIPEK